MDWLCLGWICVEELMLTENGDGFLGFSKLGLVPLVVGRCDF